MKRRRISDNIPPRQALALFHRAGLLTNDGGWQERLYKKLWARVRRLDSQFRRAEAARSAKRLAAVKSNPSLREHDRQVRREWQRRNARSLKAYNARYHREHRRRYCDFCGQSAKVGRYSLRAVKRMVPRGETLVEVTLKWCGCFGDPIENYNARVRARAHQPGGSAWHSAVPSVDPSFGCGSRKT